MKRPYTKPTITSALADADNVKNITDHGAAEDDAKVAVGEGADTLFTFLGASPGGSVELHINETAVAMLLIIVEAIAEAPPETRVRDVIVEYDGPNGARMPANLAAHGLLIALKDFLVVGNTKGPSL